MKIAMKHILIFVVCLVVCARGEMVQAHGTSIVVTRDAGHLVVTSEVEGIPGYVDTVFVEDDDDGDAFAIELGNLGDVLLWQIPGFDISGVNEPVSLSIEILARPVKDSAPLEHRVLWYWQPGSGQVKPASSELHLLGTGGRYTTLSPEDTETLSPFLLANSLAEEQGNHHGLMSFALDNSPEAAEGTYGFFARLLSNQYAPSNPFLIMLNHGVDYEQMMTAAQAINEMAMESQPAGDYNRDGTVDAADYVVWRNLPAVGEYQDWSANFARTVEGLLSNAWAPTSVPEPATAASLIWLTAILAGRRRSKR